MEPLDAPTRKDGRMTLTVLLPTTVAMPDSPPEGTRYVPYDPYTPLPEEHLDAEVLGVWATRTRNWPTPRAGCASCAWSSCSPPAATTPRGPASTPGW